MAPVLDNMTPAPLIQNCSNCSQALVPELNVVKAVVLGLILGVFIAFGVVGNILVILSVVCHRHLRTVTHYFIVNLAVADLMLSSTVLPFSAIFEILDRWVFGRVFCNVWAAVDVLCCTASIMSLCVISVDRYIGVSYPLRYPAIMTKRRALLAVMLLWVLSIVISVGPLFGWKEPAPEDESICKITEEPGYAIFSAVGSFYLPLAIILAMYCRVYVVAYRESQGLREGHKTEKSDSEEVTLRMHRGNTTTCISEDEALRSRTHFALRLLKFSREKKAAKTLGIVVGCFVLCWLPFFLVLPIGEYHHVQYICHMMPNSPVACVSLKQLGSSVIIHCIGLSDTYSIYKATVLSALGIKTGTRRISEPGCVQRSKYKCLSFPTLYAKLTPGDK